jgi:antitoxin (DNA-binding transcriptional repressor) of toxin-antitoxin stability system
MKTTMNVAEAKAKLSELLVRVERGEDVQIARAGKVIAHLVVPNAQKSAKPILGAWADLDIDLGEDPCAPEPMDALYSEQSLEDDLASPDPIPARFALLKANGLI